MPAIYPLSSEQIEIKNLAYDFAYREVLPARNLYEKDILAKEKLIEKMYESGLINTRIPEELGGLGLSLTEVCLIIEELAFACSGIACLSKASELAITYLLIAGSQEQKNKYLKPLAQYGGLAGIAPPNWLNNHFSGQLIAKQRGEKIFLNGHCPLLLNAQVAKWFVIPCHFIQDSETKEHRSIAYFIIPNPLDGLTTSASIERIGCLAADAYSVNFKDVCLDPLDRIDFTKSTLNHSIVNRGSGDMLSSTNASIISSGCLGLANAAFNEAKKYALERKTFGVPIAKHQIISFTLSDMYTDISALRLMIGQNNNSVVLGHSSKKLAFSTQIHALEMIARITNDAVQIFGAYGYAKDYPVEKHMRDAKTYQSLYGSNNCSKETLGNLLIQSSC